MRHCSPSQRLLTDTARQPLRYTHRDLRPRFSGFAVMSRGSKPGERRGGRRRGTPNKKTVLRNAALAAAAANPELLPLEFLLGIMRDPNASPELRIKVAQATLHPLSSRRFSSDGSCGVGYEPSARVPTEPMLQRMSGLAGSALGAPKRPSSASPRSSQKASPRARQVEVASCPSRL